MEPRHYPREHRRRLYGFHRKKRANLQSAIIKFAALCVYGVCMLLRWTPFRNLVNLRRGAWAFAINYQPWRRSFSRAIHKLFGLFYSRRKLFTRWWMSERRQSLRIYRFQGEIFHHPHRREENDYRWLCCVVVATGFPLALISHSERLASVA